MIDFSLAKPAVYGPVENPGAFPPITDFVAVTSLAPQADQFTRQQRALQSWVKFGLGIVAVNTDFEVAKLRNVYPMVSQWIQCPGHPDDSGRQRILDLARTANHLGKPILLINSDIVIRGEQSDLTSHINGDTALVGIRNNVRQGQVKRERWGFDVFYLTPSITESLPELDWFSMGKPGWDYWLPLHFLTHNIRATYLADRLFYHHCHPVRWSKAENEEALRLLSHHYGHQNLRRLRKRLPFPPGSSA
jgi:hypothetical protein